MVITPVIIVILITPVVFNIINIFIIIVILIIIIITITILYISIYVHIVEESLEVKLPTIWTDGKVEVGRVREEKPRSEKSRERVRRKKKQVHEKVGKSRFTAFFQWFVALGGRKIGSLKVRVRSQLARWEMKNCTPLWREAHFQVKKRRTTFGSWDVEKVTPLWRKARLEVKSDKYCVFWAFFDVQMLKKCTLINLTNLTNTTSFTGLTSTTNLANLTYKLINQQSNYQTNSTK